MNDHFGHATGDHVLRRTAGLLQRSIGPEDACGRYGGEELVVISAATTAEGAMQMAERHRAAIEALTFPELGRPTTHDCETSASRSTKWTMKPSKSWSRAPTRPCTKRSCSEETASPSAHPIRALCG